MNKLTRVIVCSNSGLTKLITIIEHDFLIGVEILGTTTTLLLEYKHQASILR